MSVEDARQLGLVEGNQRAVVISHDCDLANSSEEIVEVIVGLRIHAADNQFIGARHPRRLHLTYLATGGETVVLELRHANKQSFPVSAFETFAEPDRSLSLNEKAALVQWLVARYGRPAFPDAFERHLRKPVGTRTVEKAISRILQRKSEFVLGLFFDLGAAMDETWPENEAIPLSITVVYDAIEGGQDARESAEKIEEGLRALFELAYGPPSEATEIALDNCSAVADTEMSLADVRKAARWRVEYMSLEEPDAIGDFVGAADVTV